jgi:Tfp pilus assembly protein PilO
MPAPRASSWQFISGGGVACAALSACLWFGLVGPSFAQSQARAGLRREVAEREERAAGLNAELSAAHRELDALHRAAAHNTLTLQPASEINQRLAALTALAGHSGLSLDELHQGQASESTPHYQTLTIHLSGNGTYRACATFLHALHEQFPDTGLQSLDATRPDPATATTTPVKLTFRIDLVWYTRAGN